MPGDLLRFLDGPTGYSAWWLVAGIALAAVVIGWCAGVVVWTLPPQQLRRIPLIRAVHERLIRRRFARAIRAVCNQHAAGHVATDQAATTMRRTVRSFLAVQTGNRVQYMHVADMTAGSLAPAAPLIEALNDAQFNTASTVNVSRVGREAEELIRSWS